MILKEFPDLAWLKKKIERGFAEEPGPAPKPQSPASGFPSVIISTSTTAAWRPDVRGPLSLFCNLEGESLCATDNRFVRVGPESYFLSNQSQEYTLKIDSPSPVQTFNIHFGEHFAREALQALLTPADRLLAGSPSSGSHSLLFLNKLYPKDETFRQLIQRIRQSQETHLPDRLLLEEQLHDLLVYLLYTHRNLLREMEKLPVVKAATKQDLFRRLSFSLDYLQSQYACPVQLEELAEVACLSKFHFLRLFKQVFRLSPYQYLQAVRIQRAQALLKHTTLPVHQIAVELGFENANSFSRLFYQRMRVYPSQYREAAR